MYKQKESDKVKKKKRMHIAGVIRKTFLGLRRYFGPELDICSFSCSSYL